MKRVSFDVVKGFNEAWRNSGRKESEISIRYQYKLSHRENARRKHKKNPALFRVRGSRFQGESYLTDSLILRIWIFFSRSAMNWGSTFGRSAYGMFST